MHSISLEGGNMKYVAPSAHSTQLTGTLKLNGSVYDGEK